MLAGDHHQSTTDQHKIAGKYHGRFLTLVWRNYGIHNYCRPIWDQLQKLGRSMRYSILEDGKTTTRTHTAQRVAGSL